MSYHYIRVFILTLVLGLGGSISIAAANDSYFSFEAPAVDGTRVIEHDFTPSIDPSVIEYEMMMSASGADKDPKDLDFRFNKDPKPVLDRDLDPDIGLFFDRLPPKEKVCKDLKFIFEKKPTCDNQDTYTYTEIIANKVYRDIETQLDLSFCPELVKHGFQITLEAETGDRCVNNRNPEGQPCLSKVKCSLNKDNVVRCQMDAYKGDTHYPLVHSNFDRFYIVVTVSENEQARSPALSINDIAFFGDKCEDPIKDEDKGEDDIDDEDKGEDEKEDEDKGEDKEEEIKDDEILDFFDPDVGMGSAPLSEAPATQDTANQAKAAQYVMSGGLMGCSLTPAAGSAGAPFYLIMMISMAFVYWVTRMRH